MPSSGLGGREKSLRSVERKEEDGERGEGTGSLSEIGRVEGRKVSEKYYRRFSLVTWKKKFTEAPFGGVLLGVDGKKSCSPRLSRRSKGHSQGGQTAL